MARKPSEHVLFIASLRPIQKRSGWPNDSGLAAVDRSPATGPHEMLAEDHVVDLLEQLIRHFEVEAKKNGRLWKDNNGLLEFLLTL